MVVGADVEGYESSDGYRLNEMDQARLTIYTTKWCGDCFRTKRFLGKHGIGYDQIDITNDEDARRHVQEINGGYSSVPTIVFPSSRVVVEPSNRDLEAVLISEGMLPAATATAEG
jgi:mycoredoxin